MPAQPARAAADPLQQLPLLWYSKRSINQPSMIVGASGSSGICSLHEFAIHAHCLTFHRQFTYLG